MHRNIDLKEQSVGKVGNGNNIMFWIDSLKEGTPLCKKFPHCLNWRCIKDAPFERKQEMGLQLMDGYGVGRLIRLLKENWMNFGSVLIFCQG